MISRPGTGGRIPRALPFTGTTATAELIERLGLPVDEPAQGCQMLRFDSDPDGDGLILARLSGRELQGGETAMGQVHACLELAKKEGLRPRAIIVTIRNSGARSFDDRPDMQLVRRAIDEGWCQWVAWRDPIRLARELMPAEQFYELLRKTETRLYFASFGRETNWRQDRLSIRTLGLLGAEEREWILERTRSAIHSRYVGEGRGWPGTKRFGIRRNWATKELEVDPLQWEFVKRIHFHFAEVATDGIKGIRALSEVLERLGCQLSVEELRTILRDPIYVTGEYSVRVNGVETPQRAVPLADAIPAAIFAFNQQLLATRRGKNTRTAVGEFLLNSVVFAHEPCRMLRNSRGLRPLLRGRRQSDRQRMAYRHSPWVPQACHGLALDRDAIDPLVIDRLCTLSSDGALLRAWSESGQVPAFSPGGLLDSDARATLRQRIRSRERQKAQLTRVYLDRAAVDDVITISAYWELVGAISDEITGLQARLASAGNPAVALPVPVQAAELAGAMRAVFDDTGTPGSLIRRTALTAALIREVVVTESREGDLMIKVVPWLGGDVESDGPDTKDAVSG
jgi:DNA invertase Pin-like site-specific DNA recombinase